MQVPGDPIRRTEDKWDRWNWRDATSEKRIEKYRGMTLPIDEGIGQLRETLESLDIAKNTFVLFFSDNGPAREFPSGSSKLRAGKGSVYEGGHKVPAIAWWPGKIQAGSESNETLISIDVMPTLLSIAGISTSSLHLDGVDSAPVLFRNEPLKPRPLYWASLGNSGTRSEAMREGDWKLVVHHPKAKPGSFENESVELFHLDRDPGETNDVSSDHADKTAKMLSQLKAWYSDTQRTATKQPGGYLVDK